MNIELLNVRIYIQKNEVISDSIGNRKNTWKDYYTCYATVSAEAGKESTDAGLVVDDSKIDFTIRYCKKAAALTSTGYRVQFGSELYDILAVDHMNFKRKCIKLSCQKVRPDTVLIVFQFQVHQVIDGILLDPCCHLPSPAEPA